MGKGDQEGGLGDFRSVSEAGCQRSPGVMGPSEHR